MKGKHLYVKLHEVTSVFSYFLPGGAVDHREHMTDAAIRETKEEAGIDINLTGILSIHYLPYGNYSTFQEIILYIMFLRELCSFAYGICCFTKR